MNILNNNYASIDSMRDQLTKGNSNKGIDTSSRSDRQFSFAQVLQEKESKVVQTEQLRFSKHANERLASRDIDLSKEQVERLENGTNRAREKGIRESLVMVDDLAFIVNVKSNTVITAVKDTEDAVFTNIDGAVIG